MQTEAVAVFQQFVAAINGHDIEALSVLMTPDHLFVDSADNRTQGAEFMRTGWLGYFAMCLDFWIRIQDLLSEKETVLATGEVGGTIDGIRWQTPTAWQAIIKGGRVSEWWVFADNQPVREILARRKG